MSTQQIKLLPGREIKACLTKPEFRARVQRRKGKLYLLLYETDGTPVKTMNLTNGGESTQFAIGTQPLG